MKKCKVGIIGHFGFGSDLANGQTIKTKIVAEEINEITRGSVCYLDTHGGIRALFSTIFGCFKLLHRCDNIVILPAQNGLKIIVPVLAVANCIYHKKLHYSVIGGWLPAMLLECKWLIKYLKKFHYIYVETSVMKTALENLGINNSIIIPNCKNLQILTEGELKQHTNPPYKICTFSRVMKEKGIEDIVNVVRNINSDQGKTIYELDIYGPVDADQTAWFENLSSTFPDYIRYRGIVDFDKSVDVLKDYFVLVFPTRFFTEGLPGTIIDAYAAGIPVVSAKWESFADMIEEGNTGYGYDFEDTDQLQSILEKIASSPDAINQMKIHCIAKAQDYTTQRFKEKLSKYI